ncbi:hypothetical protein Misp03_24300 [Microbispora sp. NBRC 16548]|nr:hypothetical protein [Microbispora sp. NBRC 16548]GLX05503.1 hypothetical protein Misp03_24300 [Microbispora sp. NBRC 16548]
MPGAAASGAVLSIATALLRSSGAGSVSSGKVRSLMPEVCWRSCRTVIFSARASAMVNSGRYRRTGASRSILPSSARRSTARAVNDFDSEASGMGVSAVIASPPAV